MQKKHTTTNSNTITFHIDEIARFTHSEESILQAIKETLLRLNYSYKNIGVTYNSSTSYDEFKKVGRAPQLVNSRYYKIIMDDEADVLLMKLKGHDKDIFEAIQNPYDLEYKTLMNTMRSVLLKGYDDE